jgi:DHA1 family bicyclomycin/chloramphenicol resistance-like MFS transporter
MDNDTSATALRDSLPLALMAAIAALTPLAVDMYLPAMPQIAAWMATEISTIQNSLSVFLVGFGEGLLIFGPCSDRYGRRPLALFGLAGFALSSLLLALSSSPEMFLVCRFLQGLLGSAATVTIPAIVRDCYGKDTARGMSSVNMIMLVAPLLAPLMGSTILGFAPWQGIFAFLTLYPLLLLLLTWKLLPETLVKDPDSKPSTFSLLGNYRIIFGNRAVWPDLLTQACSSFAFFTYLTSVSFIYITYHGVSETLFGILFAVSAMALIVANYLNVRIVGHYGPRRVMRTAQVAGTLVCCALVGVTLLDWGLIPTVLCFFLLVGCLGIANVNTSSLILIAFPKHASSASAVTGTMRFGCGALAGPLLAWIHNDTPQPVAVLLLVAMLGTVLIQLLRSRVMANSEAE